MMLIITHPSHTKYQQPRILTSYDCDVFRSLKNQLDGVLENILHFRNLCQFYHSYLKQVIEAAGEHKSYCYGIFDELEDSDGKLSNAVVSIIIVSYLELLSQK